MKRIFLLTVIIFSVFVLYANKKKKNLDNLPLIHTKWVLVELFETPVVHTSDTAFIVFYDNYKCSGNLGCNLFFGAFSYGKKRIKLDYFGATKGYCSDMTLEELFLKAIKLDKFFYVIEKDTLCLLQKNSVIVKFNGDIVVKLQEKINDNQEQINDNQEHSD